MVQRDTSLISQSSSIESRLRRSRPVTSSMNMEQAGWGGVGVGGRGGRWKTAEPDLTGTPHISHVLRCGRAKTMETAAKVGLKASL